VTISHAKSPNFRSVEKMFFFRKILFHNHKIGAENSPIWLGMFFGENLPLFAGLKILFPAKKLELFVIRNILIDLSKMESVWRRDLHRRFRKYVQPIN